MISNSRIPHLLAPYIADLPQGSSTLITGTLSNSVNWLLVRYVCGILGHGAVKAQSAAAEPQEDSTEPAPASYDRGIVLVSWLRDRDFWKTEVRRATGLDLESVSQRKRFAFLDGLNASSSLTITSQNKSTQLPARDVPARMAPRDGSERSTMRPTPSSSFQHGTSKSAATDGIFSLDISKTRLAIEAALDSLTTDSAVLLLDAPDLLLALQDPLQERRGSIATAFQSMILSLRLHQRVAAVVTTLSADVNPLPSAQPDDHVQTALEIESQAFLVGSAHTANLIISARGLDTGAAGDVGGILRVTIGVGLDEDEENGGTRDWKEQELLYLVKNDGSAKVWERGAGVGVG